jgi:hypothetical protein
MVVVCREELERDDSCGISMGISMWAMSFVWGQSLEVASIVVSLSVRVLRFVRSVKVPISELFGSGAVGFSLTTFQLPRRARLLNRSTAD